jgi:hypothetical protein
MNRKKRRDIKYRRHNVEHKIAVEGIGAEALGADETGHVVVVTDRGLAMLVAGLRSIALESPEVEPLLETLENALREGAEERKANAETSTDR